MNYWLLKKKDELYPIEVVYTTEEWVMVHVEATKKHRKYHREFAYLKKSLFPVDLKKGDRFTLGTAWHYGGNHFDRIFKGDQI